MFLPPVDGLFFGGGFPECFIESLSKNISLHHDIRDFISNGGPTYAECGGLMYLCRSISWQGMEGEMVGVIPADATMEPKPVGRGYVKFRPTTAHPWPGIATANTREYCAHEFHHSRLKHLDPDLKRALHITRGFGIDGRTDGIVCQNLLATYVHQRNVQANPWVHHFVNFVRSCRYRNGQQ
jgi:cobyrinic acid a,c-diamide synthase